MLDNSLMQRNKENNFMHSNAAEYKRICNRKTNSFECLQLVLCVCVYVCEYECIRTWNMESKKVLMNIITKRVNTECQGGQLVCGAFFLQIDSAILNLTVAFSSYIFFIFFIFYQKDSD